MLKNIVFFLIVECIVILSDKSRYIVKVLYNYCFNEIKFSILQYYEFILYANKNIFTLIFNVYRYGDIFLLGINSNY